MSSPAYLLFESQAQRLARRRDMTVILVIYLVLGIFQLLGVYQVDSPLPGRDLLRALTILHSFLAALLGMRLSGDVVGDRTSGVVGLLYLAGVRPWAAVMTQWLSLGAVYFRIWLARIPLLVLCLALGGPTLAQVAIIEALLFGIFILTTATGHLLGHYCDVRATLRVIYPVAYLLDFLLFTPDLVVTLVARRWPQWVPNGADEFVALCHRGRVTSAMSQALSTPRPSWELLAPLGLHLVLAAVLITLWRRGYYANLNEGQPETENHVVPAPLDSKTHSKSARRPSRPVWDDALAWQAYYVHSPGQYNHPARLAVLAIVCLVVGGNLVAGHPSQHEMALLILIATTAIMMFIGQAKASDCIQKEIRDQTLPDLMMTPHTPLELLDGWDRGAWKLRQVDLILYVLCLGGCLWYSPNQLAPAVCVGATMILACGPFFVLSPLIPYTFRGMLLGLLLVSIPFLALGPVVLVMKEVHPWLGVALAIPMAWLWNRGCRWTIPRWVERKVIGGS